jgi:hypothetical protein
MDQIVSGWTILCAAFAVLVVVSSVCVFIYTLALLVPHLMGSNRKTLHIPKGVQTVEKGG